MLLLLSCADLRGQNLTVTAVIEAGGSPPSTGLRWLTFLEELGFTLRHPNPADPEDMLVELTDAARKKLREYLKHISSTHFSK